MTHLFYILGVFLILAELLVLNDQKKVYHRLTVARRLKKAKIDFSLERYGIFYALFSVLGLYYFTYCLVGLMSSQWVLFAVLLFISFIPKPKLWLRYLDTIISVMILIFILLNKYHFHINFIALLK